MWETASVKAVIASGDGNVAGIGQVEYGIGPPRLNFVEQNPDVWRRSTCAAIKDVLAKANVSANQIAAVGFPGRCTVSFASTRTSAHCETQLSGMTT